MAVMALGKLIVVTRLVQPALLWIRSHPGNLSKFLWKMRTGNIDGQQRDGEQSVTVDNMSLAG